MSKLIDDVLDFAWGRMGTGIGVSLEKQSHLTGAFVEVVEALRHAHLERSIQTAFDLPRPVRCDRGRLQQLLSNLLGNALTHGATDSPVDPAHFLD